MKKALLVIVPLLLLCVTSALVLTGVIKLPFLKLGKKKPAAVANQTPAKATPPKKPATTFKPSSKPVVALKPKPSVDPAQGAKKLAKLWNEMDSTKLSLLIKDWKDPEAAKVLVLMDADRVAELLSKLPPAKASSLSKSIQKIASVVADDGVKAI